MLEALLRYMRYELFHQGTWNLNKKIRHDKHIFISQR